MKKNKLLITINRPVSTVFAFTLDPNNTPLWVPSIIYEETSESPVRKGTIYKNKDKEGNWSEYEVTSFEKDTSFVFSLMGGAYYVRYTFKPVENDATELEYYEWVGEGELDEPFTQATLEKLKMELEK